MLNGNAQNFLPLPRIPILQSVTHLSSSSTVIQIISTRWTGSESAKARLIIIFKRLRKRNIRFPWFPWERKPVFSELPFIKLLCAWRSGDGHHDRGGQGEVCTTGPTDAQRFSELSKETWAFQAWEKQDIQTVLHLPLLFMPILFQKTGF